MLSGEGNAGERWKTTIGLISKKATLHVQHTFFVHFFAVVLHDYNVKLPETSLKEMSHTFLFTFFFLLPLMFTGLPLVATSISHVVTAAITKFSCRFSNKKVSFVFLSLALDLCRPFYRWASLACRLLSRFLCLSLARLYSRFVGTPINLSLIYFRQYGYRNNFHFSFSSIFTL